MSEMTVLHIFSSIFICPLQGCSIKAEPPDGGCPWMEKRSRQEARKLDSPLPSKASLHIVQVWKLMSIQVCVCMNGLRHVAGAYEYQHVYPLKWKNEKVFLNRLSGISIVQQSGGRANQFDPWVSQGKRRLILKLNGKALVIMWNGRHIWS